MAADLHNYDVSNLGAVQVTVPRVAIAFQIVDSTTGVLIDDRTGANALVFPAVMAVMTQAERDLIREEIAQAVIKVFRQRKGY